MEVASYKAHTKLLLEDYLLSDSIAIYISVIVGIFFCKMVYDLSHVFSAVYFKGYSGLSRFQQIEWNNRAMSTFHAIFITTVSLYLAFWSNLYSDDRLAGLITHRSSSMSTFALGVSVGYFLVDLGMIFWFYPSLGGLEYVAHHLLSMVGVTYAMVTGEAQVYTYMVLISEATTPEINLRWYLDTAGMKRSTAYVVNGVILFLAWLVARILWFMYLFYHIYTHYDQVRQMRTLGFFLVLVVPSLLSVMNLMWFGKIIRGLKKTLRTTKTH